MAALIEPIISGIASSIFGHGLSSKGGVVDAMGGKINKKRKGGMVDALGGRLRRQGYKKNRMRGKGFASFLKKSGRILKKIFNVATDPRVHDLVKSGVKTYKGVKKDYFTPPTTNTTTTTDNTNTGSGYKRRRKRRIGGRIKSKKIRIKNRRRRGRGLELGNSNDTNTNAGPLP